MKVLFVVIAIGFIFQKAFAQEHQPTWFLMDDRAMSSFDMLTTRLGLIAIDDNGVRFLAKYDSGAINGIFALKGSANSIIISDQNVAYIAVSGDGIYVSANNWKDYTLLLSNPNPYILAVRGKNILANLGGIFNFSNDGTTFQQAGGISPGDTITAAEIFSSQIAIAVTGKKIYRSHDGGRNWNVILDTLSTANSLYIDRSHSLVYAGGSQIMQSADSGLTWHALSSLFFTLSGPVVGARDCSGNLYLAPDPKQHGAMYRSVDQGRFFQEAGPAIFSSVALKKGVALDRGSTFFWLDKSGLIGVVRDGIDSALTDSVANRITIRADSGIRNSLCNNSVPTQFSVAITFDQCTGIILDSLKQITSNSSFSAKFSPGFLGDTAPAMIPFTFRAVRPGLDTAHYRVRFHSPITQNIEQKYFDLIALGAAGSPDISFNPLELDFPTTGLDSIHTLTILISNPGCDSLVIDTTYSTNPAIFIPKAQSFPVIIAPGKSVKQTITFNPHLAEDYLESLGIGTNIGNRFITLRGTGTAPVVSEVPPNAETEGIKIYPNPAKNLLTISSIHSLPNSISLFDELGKEVRQFSTDQRTTVNCNISGLPNGSYILDFGGGTFERIIIEH